MNVGSIRYASSRVGYGILDDSTLDQKSEYYRVDEEGNATSINDLDSIADGGGSPFDKCTQLVVAANHYFKTPEQKAALWKPSMEQLCADCDSSGITGLCQLCDQFPLPAEAVLSCYGYDNLSRIATQTVGGVIHFANEVINADGRTYLYVLKHGFQTFVMQLMRRQVITNTLVLGVFFLYVSYPTSQSHFAKFLLTRPLRANLVWLRSFKRYLLV